MLLVTLSNCFTNSSHNFVRSVLHSFRRCRDVDGVAPGAPWGVGGPHACAHACPCPCPSHPIHPAPPVQAPLQNPPGQTLSTNSSQTDSDRLEFSLMFAGTTFWKPPNARQAQHRDQTKTSGHTSQSAPAMLGLQVGSAPKPDGRQKQGWCSNGAFQKPKHKPEVKF